jgi:aminopeptidase N
MRPRLALAATAAAATVVASLAAPAQAAPPVAGAAGAGDPYFPRQGNGGYDVSYYGLDLHYVPSTHRLAGTAHIHGQATEALSRFDLDLRRNLKVSAVRVNGTAAAFQQPAGQVQELVITPKSPLAAGAALRVDVRYAGTANYITDPDGSPDGWIPTKDGVFVASEPQGSPTWFPVNDTPTDKASYRVSVTVPRGLTVLSNGALIRHRTGAATTTWAWRIYRPISSYLVTATMGTFTVTRGTTPRGVPYVTAVDPSQVAAATPVLAKLPAIVDYYSSVFGRYPFGSVGAIVDNAPQVGYALETATKPVFDRTPDELTLAH